MFVFQVFVSHHDRFQAVVLRPDLSKVYQDVVVKRQVTGVLESSCGVVEATTVANYTMIFDLMLPILLGSVSVIGKCYDRLQFHGRAPNASGFFFVPFEVS